MVNLQYRGHLSLPEAIVDSHLNAVESYLIRRNDGELLGKFDEGDRAFEFGNLETAVTNFQAVYDAIPENDQIEREPAHVVLIQARRCQRLAGQKQS